jgi:hypothetical protein
VKETSVVNDREIPPHPLSTNLQDDVNVVFVFEVGDEFHDVFVVEGLVDRDLELHLLLLVSLLEERLRNDLAGVRLP